MSNDAPALLDKQGGLPLTCTSQEYKTYGQQPPERAGAAQAGEPEAQAQHVPESCCLPQKVEVPEAAMSEL